MRCRARLVQDLPDGRQRQCDAESGQQAWVLQRARNLLMDLGDGGTRAGLVLHDRDASFTAAFDAIFNAEGMSVGAVPFGHHA